MIKTLAAAAATFLAALLFTPAAFAADLTAPVSSSRVQLPGFVVGQDHVRVLNVYRAKQPIRYAWTSSRFGDEEGDWTPVGIRDVIRVEVEVRDPSPSRLDADEGDAIFTLTIAPESLTPAQTDALSRAKRSERVAAFHVSTSRVTTVARRVDYARSQLCDSDQMRCQEYVVYEDARTEATDISVHA